MFPFCWKTFESEGKRERETTGRLEREGEKERDCEPAKIFIESDLHIVLDNGG
jgi:hypothetical protein